MKNKKKKRAQCPKGGGKGHGGQEGRGQRPVAKRCEGRGGHEELRA